MAIVVRPEEVGGGFPILETSGCRCAFGVAAIQQGGMHPMVPVSGKHPFRQSTRQNHHEGRGKDICLGCAIGLFDLLCCMGRLVSPMLGRATSLWIDSDSVPPRACEYIWGGGLPCQPGRAAPHYMSIRFSYTFLIAWPIFLIGIWASKWGRPLML